MTRTRSLLAAAVVLFAACKKPPDAGASAAGSGSSAQPAAAGSAAAPAAGSGSAAPPAAGSGEGSAPAAAPPPPSGPYELPADARVLKEREGKKGDATTLGAQLTLHLVNRIGTDDPGDPARHVDQLLAITGTGSVVVELGYVSDADPAYRDHMIQPIAPLTPARPFSPDDAKTKLAFTGPLLYLKHWKAGDIAVAQDGDSIAVWRSDTTQGEGEEGKAGAWYPQARIAIAPGAKVTAQ